MNIADTLELLAKKGWIQEIDIPTILEDEEFKKLSVKKVRKKKTIEERAGVIDPTKCNARIWKEGYDNIQCSFSKVDGDLLCSCHRERFEKNGGWWLGMVTEPRPEKPVLNGVVQYWKTDKEGNEVVNDQKTSQEVDTGVIKKKRGRPKGSKNKKQTVKKEMTKEEILTLLNKKLKEEGVGETGDKVIDDGKEVIYLVDNVPYEISDGEIMDPEDFSPIGQSDGNGGIIFEDEDAEKKHKENIKRYSK